ncbi:unnamed protein product [Medioppia subpectinata]|uniref:ribonuclease H n=1 Tax=Medioppia subpectinata TaxID=1979941 RepID=A0A7R9LIC7_9ACAR|nr:unnamed protein product [Medioppia subpectinata]CAG2119076.1 unnamed protein product [Medioppia subpectinata]
MDKFYGVRIGCKPGVYRTRKAAMSQMNHPFAQCKSFNTYEEADDYVKSGPICVNCFKAMFDPKNGGPMETDWCGPWFQIYTDGACRGNGTAAPIAGIGVHFPTRYEYDLSEPLPERQTNNRAEIWAVIRALQTAHTFEEYRVEIITDSDFLVKAMTKWIHKWYRNDWKNANGEDVVNKYDFLELENACDLMKSVKWTKVAAHSGIAGNMNADQLANQAIDDQLRRY